MPMHGSRRDRHGRGARTGAHPWNGAQRFEQLLHEAVASLDANGTEALANVHFVVADIPDLTGLDSARGDTIPLARNETVIPSTGTAQTRITVYRHPITVRCTDGAELAALLLDVVIEQLAEAWGVEPEEIDERYGDSE